MTTGFAELDAVLDRWVADVRAVLGPSLVGAYLVGSFALGDADAYSDVDVLVATAGPLTPAQEAGLRALHAGLPDAGGWAAELEGSYAPVDELRTLAGRGRRWLYVDRGARTMEESTRCNTLEHRWTLRHAGVALPGPPAVEVVDALPAGALRAEMRAQLPRLRADLAGWTALEEIAWAQRYAVASLCRPLYSVATDAVASKRAALQWARETLDPEWQPLLDAVLAERARGFDPDDPLTPDSVDATRCFAVVCEALSRESADLWTSR